MLADQAHSVRREVMPVLLAVKGAQCQTLETGSFEQILGTQMMMDKQAILLVLKNCQIQGMIDGRAHQTNRHVMELKCYNCSSE